MHTGGAEGGRDEVTSSSPDSATSILERAQVIAEQLHEEALREAERATAEATRLEAENQQRLARESGLQRHVLRILAGEVGIGAPLEH